MPSKALLTVTRAKQIINNIIQNLTAQKLKEALKEAQLNYMLGTDNYHNDGDQKDFVIAKNSLTGGVSMFNRYHKSSQRLENKTINDENAKDILAKFLEGEGGTNTYSLKYLLVTYLLEDTKQGRQLYKNIVTSHEAGQLITYTIEVLNNKMGLQLDSQLKAKLNNISNNIFQL